ncbi:hypothetical protein KCU67_g13168, partial [Aureobasidium melanogenum]
KVTIHLATFQQPIRPTAILWPSRSAGMLLSTRPAGIPCSPACVYPTFDAAAPVQQDAPANTKAASTSVSRKRKGRDEQEHKDDQLNQPPEKKSRNEKAIERMKQKASTETI